MSNEIAKSIFYLSEDSIYPMLEIFGSNQAVEKSFVYCFMKAFYIHTIKLYFLHNKCNANFDELYHSYKEELKSYYQINNPTIEDELLDQILNFFDNSFMLIDSLEFYAIEDNYEFRHYTIRVLELLRIMLENNSKTIIKETIFDKQVRTIINQKDEIFNFLLQGKNYQEKN